MTAAPVLRRFLVHAADDARHCREVEGEGFEAAALAFLEEWSGSQQLEGEVTVFVLDREAGREQCLCVDLDARTAEPCR